MIHRLSYLFGFLAAVCLILGSGWLGHDLKSCHKPPPAVHTCKGIIDLNLHDSLPAEDFLLITDRGAQLEPPGLVYRSRGSEAPAIIIHCDHKPGERFMARVIRRTTTQVELTSRP